MNIKIIEDQDHKKILKVEQNGTYFLIEYVNNTIKFAIFENNQNASPVYTVPKIESLIQGIANVFENEVPEEFMEKYQQLIKEN
jgi:hypothetical protein